ncbi:MAG: hypothetical protein ACOCZ6_00345 [Nanoarchaeota archaeon]
MGKKAQNTAGGAAAFIAIIGGAILLYLMLLPPADREELLGDETSQGGTGTSTPEEKEQFFNDMNKTPLKESPGRISYLRQDEFDHNLPAINLYTSSSSEDKKIGKDVYVKSSVFDEKTKEISFTTPSEIEDVYLAFSTGEARGKLIGRLNGETVFEKKITGGQETVSIRDDLLEEENTLQLEVSGVGWKFWTTNKYNIETIRAVYKEIDTSRQQSKNTFIVSDSEKHNLDYGVLKFNPDCNQNEAGKVTVLLNRNIVYQAVPDCGMLNRVEITSDMINAGENKVEFKSDKGRYSINQINLQTKMEKMTFPVYYFDLEEKLFDIESDESEEEHECGDSDGVCPSGCPEYKDKDCCLEKTSKYWCDVQPSNANERCRSVVYEEDCESCPSGYEDEEGNPPEVCEGDCGDDTDGVCPEGCSRNYDKDCCFEHSEKNYWCDEVPKYGLSNVCMESIHEQDCDNCPSGYETLEGSFSCPDESEDYDETARLKPGYDVWLKFSFLDDGERKAAKVFVNGRQFYLDTREGEYERKINDYVEDGSNAIKIEPDMDSLDIRKLEAEVKRR